MTVSSLGIAMTVCREESLMPLKQAIVIKDVLIFPPTNYSIYTTFCYMRAAAGIFKTSLLAAVRSKFLG